MTDFPSKQISEAEFFALPEYSASHPTGVTPGKRWRRHDGAHDREYIAAGGKPRWLLCMYERVAGEHPMCRVVYSIPRFGPGTRNRPRNIRSGEERS